MRSIILCILAILIVSYLHEQPLTIQEEKSTVLVPSSEQVPKSPRIRQLLEAGPSAAVTFWDQIGRQGTPLIEPYPEDTTLILLTFLWRATTPVENVVVFSALSGWTLPDNMLHHIAETDVWYRTYVAPNDIRFGYRFSVNDNLRSIWDDPDWAMRAAGFRRDPLNPNHYIAAGNVYSVVSGPGVEPSKWTQERSDISNGRVRELVLSSEYLDGERTVHVYMPPGYDSTSATYPILLVLDGKEYTSTVPTPTILDNLIEADQIDPVIGVFVENVPGRREQDLGGSVAFSEFVARELLPQLRSSFRIGDDAARNIVAGSSFGGLAAAFIALRHPDLFQGVVAQSGSFWWSPSGEEPGYMIRAYREARDLPTRFYLEVGSLETGSTRIGDTSMIMWNRRMRGVLEEVGYLVGYNEYAGGHDYASWRESLGDALIAVQAR